MRIEGIKLSEELVAVNFRNPATCEDAISRICQTLANDQVNLAFFTQTGMGDDVQASLCAAVTDLGRVKAAIAAEPGMASWAEFISPVGQVSIFHHHFSVKMLGLILNIFGKIPLPVYGTASSLSSLTIITDYDRLGRAVRAIREHLEVPSDQIYLRPETRVVQSREIKKE